MPTAKVAAMTKMINVKTAELTGPQLDWAVAKAEGFRVTMPKRGGAPNYAIVEVPNAIKPFMQCCLLYGRNLQAQWSPSTFWFVGGPIIERENIWLAAPRRSRTEWSATVGYSTDDHLGSTPLIAAMRAFVASKLGDEVEVPEVCGA